MKRSKHFYVIGIVVCCCLGLSLRTLVGLSRVVSFSEGQRQAESVALPHQEETGRPTNRTITTTTEATSTIPLSLDDNDDDDEMPKNPYHAIQSNTNKPCVTEACIRQQAQQVARVWPLRPYQEWCIPGKGYYNTAEQFTHDENKQYQGLLLMKTPKCASTTASEVVFRVGLSKHCAIRLDHQPGDVYGHRDKAKSFYFGPVRDPADRAMSGLYHFFFKEEEYGRNPVIADDHVLERLESTGGVTSTFRLGGFMYWYMRTHKGQNKGGRPVSSLQTGLNQELALNLVKELFDNDYDYFMVAERMEESIVVFALLTGLNVTDVFPAVDSNKAGGYALRPTSRSGAREWACMWNNKARYTPTVTEYFESDRWRSLHYSDYVLHRAANISLDWTIQHLGEDRVKEGVAEFRRLKGLVQEQCPEEQLGDGCDAEGYRREETCIADAYRLKFGCGYQCMDKVLATQGAPRTLDNWTRLVSSELQRAGGNAPLAIKPSEQDCLTDECMHQEARHLARVWDPKPYSAWCVPGSGVYQTNPVNAPHWKGLLLTKTPRCASSTAASVVLRIGEAHQCAVRFDYQKGSAYVNRTKESSFLFGPVRDPGERALSAVSSVVFGSQVPSDDWKKEEQVIRALNTPGVTAGFRVGGFMYNYLKTNENSMKVYDPSVSPTRVNRAMALVQVVELLNDYDYLMVADRMDESLVVLALLTDLDLKDVVPVDLQSGSYQRRAHAGEADACVSTNNKKQNYTAAVSEYLLSDEWRAMHYADYVLYKAVHLSLDMTILHLGRERVDQALEEFYRLQALVTAKCPEMGGGCNEEGVKIASDDCPGAHFRLPLGCGYKCMAAVLKEEPTRSF